MAKYKLKGLWNRNGTYWMTDTLPVFGRVRISLKTQSLGEALRKRDAILANPSAYLTPSDIEDFREYQADKGVSERWQDECEWLLSRILNDTGRGIRELTPADVAKWLAARPAPSRVSYARIIRGFGRWQAAHGRTDISILIPKERKPANVRKRFLTAQEAASLIEAAAPDEDLSFAIYCGLHAGLRKGEIIAARPHWFDLDAGLLHVQNEADWKVKDRDARTIPLTTGFLAFLRSYGIRAPYMLKPDIAPGVSLYRWDFRARWNNLLRSTGIVCTFHDLRRTFASHLVSKGVSIYKVAKWLGDGVAITEKVYGHLLPADDDINRAWS